jgi:hypothetical protein
LTVSGGDPSPVDRFCPGPGFNFLKFGIEYVPALDALQILSVNVLGQRQVAGLAAGASLEQNHLPSSPSVLLG